MNLQPKFRGAMLGLAVGDAVGTTLEFKAPGSFAKIDDMVETGAVVDPALSGNDCRICDSVSVRGPNGNGRRPRE
jgi:ADP-ribosylglycohydrolase